MGTIKATKAEATAPMGMEKRPRFQGPGLKRLPTKKTRMNCEHSVRVDLHLVRGGQLRQGTYDRGGEGDESGRGADAE